VRRRKIPKIIVRPRTVDEGVQRVPKTRMVKPVSGRPIQNNSSNLVDSLKLLTSFDLPKKRSNRLFIIAGGPSIKDVNLSLLKNEDTMCVNAAVKMVKNPTYFVTMDYSFFAKNVISINEINKKISSKSFFVLKTDNPNLIIKNGIVEDSRHNFPYTHLNEFSHIIGTSSIVNKDKGFGEKIESFSNGDNSGFSAIQLGILLGYEEIYLIGFDLGFKKDDTHFHNWYGKHSNIKNKITEYKNTLMAAIRSYTISANWIKKPNIFTITDSPINTYVPQKKLEDVINVKPITKEVEEKSYVIVSYYTINTPYEQEAIKLKKSLERLEVPHDIVGVKNLGNWQANTRFKAKFMQEMLIKHKGKSVVWVDSDAVIHSYPKLFDEYTCDVAVRWQDFRWRKNECLSGTIYLANNERTLELCKKWEGANVAEGPGAKTFEQWNLGSAIEEMRKSGKIKDENLPPEYTMIFDSMREMYPNIIPVIEHFQASRKLRNKV
jgi:hypothetical protein